MKYPKKIIIPRKPKYISLKYDNNFFTLFKKIEKRFANCFLFESLGEESHISRYSLIGFDPDMILSARKKSLIVTQRNGSSDQYNCNNPYQLLRKIIPQNIISRKYTGGLTGYLSYDCINFFEPKLDIQSNNNFSIFKFGMYTDGLILDKMTDELMYFYFIENRLFLIKEIIQSDYNGNGKLFVTALGNTMNKKQHSDSVKIVKKNIINGNIFQCEVGFRSEFILKGDYINIYEELRKVNPSPHMYYLKFKDENIIGASPELLFRMRQGEMETYPLAGTTKRGNNETEDRILAKILLQNPKEIAEHNMLVDLHRNDLGKVAKFGTVKVRNLMDIKRFSHVQHISSEIVGIVNESEDMFSALASNFPAGTLSGAPKIEAIKIIDSLEKTGRGPYGGGVGTFSFNGDCTIAIPIRTVFCKGKEAYVQTSGGNVYDSNANDEYIEIERKLAATKKVLNMFTYNKEK